LVPAGPDRVLDDGLPRQDRVVSVGGLGLAEQAQQGASDIGIANAGGGVGVPRERGTARAAARFVLGHIGARAGVVGGLGLPGDEPVLDVDVPGARTGAVDSVSGADDLVVRPAVAVEGVALAPAPQVELALVVGDLGTRGEELPAADERIHERIVGGRAGGPGRRGLRGRVPFAALCHVLGGHDRVSLSSSLVCVCGGPLLSAVCLEAVSPAAAASGAGGFVPIQSVIRSAITVKPASSSSPSE